MKTPMLLCTAILLVVFLPSGDCRAVHSSASTKNGPDPQSDLQQSVLPLWIRIGEGNLMHLGKAYKDPSRVAPKPREMAFADGAFSMQLAQLQRLLQDKVGDLGDVDSRSQDEVDEMIERGKRLDDPPISLDLTFYLLREVLEMARAEQLAQQAYSNSKIMELIGK